ncbi:phosphate ABC transporter permease PstA [Cellulomonas sp. Marseille-Q8402]
MTATTPTPTPSPEVPQGSASLRELLQGNDRRRRRTDITMRVLITAAFVVAMLPLLSLTYTVVSQGIGRLDGYFLLNSMRGVFGGMDAGGIYHAIVGTLEITLFAALISVPIGLLAAIYLVEYGGGKPLAKLITFLVDVMTGIPSIVAGLFAYALFALLLGPGAKFGAIGSVALSVLMIPVVIRSSEEMLRLVPNELREASLALGVPRWLTIIKVVLRTSVAGLTTGVMLAIARVIGETAPLLLTVGVVDSINFNLFEGRMMTLPVYVYRQYAQGLVPCAEGDAACIPDINLQRAWAAALTLFLIVMVLNLIGRLVSRLFAPKIR